MMQSIDKDFKNIDNNKQFDNLAEIYPQPIVIHQNGEILYVNPAAMKTIRAKEYKEVIGKSIVEFIHVDSQKLAFERLSKILDGDETGWIEQKFIRTDGTIIYTEVAATKITYDNKPVVMSIFKDITERKNMQIALEEKEERFRCLFENNPDAIITCNLEGKFIYVNPASEKTSGYSTKELLKMDFGSLLHPEDLNKVLNHFKNSVEGKSQEHECRMIHKDGHIVELSVKSFPMVINGKITGVYAIAKDITEKKQRERHIEYLAYHDILTGLPNRGFFKEQLDKEIDNYSKNKDEIAVMFIDLDRFKWVNDTMGHLIGDMVLKKAGERFLKVISDNDIVCRHGGDEFIILLKNYNKKEVEKVAKRIICELSRAFNIKNREIYISPSIGISMYPFDGKDSETLIKNADMAMYRSKNQGKNTYRFYDVNKDSKLFIKINLENDLRRAVKNKEFILYYQPQIDLNTDKVIGMEALIRWNHPKHGMISPLEFIPLAEETGLIIPIGKWVVETACLQNRKWQELGILKEKISVNISACQFKDENFVNIIEEALKKSGLEGKYLELEITESMANNTENLAQILDKLKKLGVYVALDDFGSGYSSLSIIRDLPIDKIKIDKSFIDAIKYNNKSSALVKTIIDMGINLNFDIIAEGIEVKEQAKILKEYRCNSGQGYFYHKPMCNKSIEKLFKNKTIV